MNVGELIDFLSTQPRDRLVVMASDAEGNGHSPLDNAEECMYTAESTWSGEVDLTPEQYTEAVARDGEDEWDEAPDGAVRAVVLGPVN